MAGLEYRPSSFFKFYSGDFERKLSIPIAFAKDHRDFLSQISMNLTRGSEKVWEVKIKNIDGRFYITDGWSDFVRDNGVTESKLLIFHINGESSLRVSIFGNDSCLELPSSPNPSNGGETFFVRELKEYNMADQRMDLPKRFVEDTGIWRTMKMELEDGRGKRWPVKVTDRNKKMYNMTKGWVAFVRGNNLQLGTVLSFEFVPGSDNVVKVNVREMANGSHP